VYDGVGVLTGHDDYIQLGSVESVGQGSLGSTQKKKYIMIVMMTIAHYDGV